VKRLLGAWPHANPPDPQAYAASLAAVLAAYPLGLVQECCDPRTGLARVREFPPTVAALVEWLDKRLQWHQTVAQYKGAGAPRIEQKFSDEHRKSMIERMQTLIHDLFDPAKAKPWTRPVGPFETPDDKWNERRRAAQPQAAAE
jgi:hypothetical protein